MTRSHHKVRFEEASSTSVAPSLSTSRSAPLNDTNDDYDIILRRTPEKDRAAAAYVKIVNERGLHVDQPLELQLAESRRRLQVNYACRWFRFGGTSTDTVITVHSPLSRFNYNKPRLRWGRWVIIIHYVAWKFDHVDSFFITRQFFFSFIIRAPRQWLLRSGRKVRTKVYTLLFPKTYSSFWLF